MTCTTCGSAPVVAAGVRVDGSSVTPASLCQTCVDAVGSSFVPRGQFASWLDDGDLVMRVPLSDPVPSSSGRSYILRSGGGKLGVDILGKPARYSLSVYVKRGDAKK